MSFLISFMLLIIIIYFSYILIIKTVNKLFNFNITENKYLKIYYGFYIAIPMLVTFLVITLFSSKLILFYLGKTSQQSFPQNSIKSCALYIHLQEDYKCQILNKKDFKSLKVISKKYLTYTDFINSNKINILTLISILSLFLLFLKLHSLKNINEKLGSMVEVFLWCFSLVGILISIGIILSLFLETLKFFHLVPLKNFIFGLKWNPDATNNISQNLGLIPLLNGTILIALIAIIFSSFLGIFSGIYLSEYMPKNLQKIIKPILDVLAGIPTIIYGFFAAITLTPIIQSFLSNFNLILNNESSLIAGIVIGIMITPIITSLTYDVFKTLPKNIKEGALGLGLTKNESIRKICFQMALPNIISSIILAFSRAIGETMIVVMASGLAAKITLSPFDSVTTITTQIVIMLQGDQEFNNPKTLSAFALGFILFLITLFLNIISLYITKKYGYNKK
jgi:phosphate transport system permease protein